MIKKDIKLKLQRLMSTPFSLFHPFCLKTFLSYNLNILNVQNLSYGLFILRIKHLIFLANNSFFIWFHVTSDAVYSTTINISFLDVCSLIVNYELITLFLDAHFLMTNDLHFTSHWSITITCMKCISSMNGNLYVNHLVT